MERGGTESQGLRLGVIVAIQRRHGLRPQAAGFLYDMPGLAIRRDRFAPDQPCGRDPPGKAKPLLAIRDDQQAWRETRQEIGADAALPPPA